MERAGDVEAALKVLVEKIGVSGMDKPTDPAVMCNQSSSYWSKFEASPSSLTLMGMGGGSLAAFICTRSSQPKPLKKRGFLMAPQPCLPLPRRLDWQSLSSLRT